MTDLFIEDTRHLSAAQGWIALGNHLEAFNELEKIAPRNRATLEVLSVRWEVYQKANHWTAAGGVASAVQKVAPDRIDGYVWRSVSLEKLGCTQDAYDNLEPVAYKFPGTGIIAYLLAVYACQLQRMPEAKAWLTCAFASPEGKELKLRALDEKALEPFWGQIGKL